MLNETTEAVRSAIEDRATYLFFLLKELNFDYRDSILVYNSGYDPEKYAWLSPGIVLLSYCIQWAIESGRAKFDFLRGDEEYKFRFGAEPTEIYRLLITRKD